MKKNTARKNTKTNKNTRTNTNTATTRNGQRTTSANSWPLSIYVYWFIILFFIAAAFYVLGRSQGGCDTATVKTDNVEITEEKLLQPTDYYSNAREKLVSGDLTGAIADLTTAIDAGNATTEMYILRGEAYMQIADYRNALSDFNTAIEMDSMNAVAYYDRALLNTRLEDYNSALSDINNALAAQTAKPSAVLQMRDLYAKRGQLNLWLKNWQGAVADYTNSLARPEGTVNPSVYADRAEAYTQLGNYSDAVNDYSTAIRVISEQIQGATTTAERESLSSGAMTYFEKSAALNLALGDMTSAHSDLNSAYTIAAALADTTSMNRIQNLISDLNNR